MKQAAAVASARKGAMSRSQVSDARMGEHADAGGDEKNHADPVDEVFAGGEARRAGEVWRTQPERQKRGGQGRRRSSGPEASIWRVRGGSDGEAGDDMSAKSIAGNSGTTTDATLRAEDFRAFANRGDMRIVAECDGRRVIIGSVQLNRNRPNQAGCGQPDRVERGVNRQIDARTNGELNHAGCKRMEQRRIVFVVRPQVGSRAGISPRILRMK